MNHNESPNPITVRLPDDLHQAVTELADRDDRSRNKTIIALLREAIRHHATR